jgi:hypothetical protein
MVLCVPGLLSPILNGIMEAWLLKTAANMNQVPITFSRPFHVESYISNVSLVQDPCIVFNFHFISEGSIDMMLREASSDLIKLVNGRTRTSTQGYYFTLDCTCHLASNQLEDNVGPEELC